MKSKVLPLLALLVASPALAQSTGTPISALPQIGAPQPADLFIIEHMSAPVGQRTNSLSAAGLLTWLGNSLGSTTPFQGLSTAILAEVSRAQAAEASITASLTSETTRAKAAEGANTALITAETTRAQGAETTNASAISTEKTRALAAEALLAPLASPTFTGAPTAPTPPAGDNSLKLPTTAFVSAAVQVEASRASAAETANTTAISAEAATARNAANLTSGTVPAARLPVPSTSTLGAVQALPATANAFLTGIGTNGVPTAAQPSFANLSGTAAASQLPASGVTAGTYVLPTFAVDLYGRITSASQGVLSGDVATTAGSLTATIQSGAVTNAKLASTPAGTIKGNATGASAAPADLTVAQAKALLGFAGSGSNSDITALLGLTTALPPSEGGTGVTTSAAELARIGAVSTATTVATGQGLSGGGPLSNSLTLSIANAALTNALLANVPAGTLKGNPTGSSAPPTDNTLSAYLDAATSSTQGSVLYRNASGWVALTPGTSGQFLQTQGAGANPAWAGVTGASGGTVTSVATGGGLTGGPITSSGTISDATYPMQERITLASGTPVMATTVSAAGTVYVTPYHGRIVALWNGSDFVSTPFSQLSLATSGLAAGNVYDVFVWNNGGTVTATFGPAWSAGATAGSNTARGSGAGSTALSTVNGMPVNAVAISGGPAAGFGTYLGTIATDAGGATVSFSTGSAATGGGAATIGLWNAWNRVPVSGQVRDTTSSWTYAGSTWRAANGSATIRVTFVTGLIEDTWEAAYNAVGTVSSSGWASGVGLNSTTAYSGETGYGSGAYQSLRAEATATVLGSNYMSAIEDVYTGGTLTAFGNGVAGVIQSGFSYRGRY